jgi:phosphatidylinositol alpha-1,6-mannosyltransferase
MKRVLIFSLAYYPHVGGAEVAIKEITDRIPDVAWHMVTMNFGGDVPAEQIGKVVVHRVGSGASYLDKILFIPRAVFAARDLNRERRFDAYWVMMSYMLFPVVLLRFMGVRVPYLLTLQEGDPWEHMFSRWFILPFRPLLKMGFVQASAVQAISAYLGTWAARMGCTGRVAIIGNGVDLARFVASHPRPLSSREVVLITTSRLVYKNGLDDVIRALTLLPSEVRFRVYGTGKEEQNLRALAKRLGVASRVEFRGFVQHEELPAVLAEGNIFVRPSRSEGMGNSFIEAMAAGLPVIATQEGGIADFLYDAARNPDKETTGWAVDKDSPGQIAEAVTRLIADPERAAKVKGNARALVQERYDWDLIAKQMRALFATLGV